MGKTKICYTLFLLLYNNFNPFTCLGKCTDLKDLFYDERLGYFEYAKETTVSTTKLYLFSGVHLSVVRH